MDSASSRRPLTIAQLDHLPMATNAQRTVVVEPSGYLDMPAAQVFEQQILDLLDGGARFFVIGFAKVDLITSAGIRVLVELTRRLQPHQGALVLYGLNDRVKTVFSVAGLIERFRIVVSKEDAMLEIAARRATPATSRSRLSSLTRLVGRVLGSVTEDSAAARPLAADAPRSVKSTLTAELAHLLEDRRADPPA